MNDTKRGVGRPSQGKIKVSYKLAPDVVEYLRSHNRPAAQLIEEAIRTHFMQK